MKKYRVFILLIVVIIVMMITGYLMKKNRVVYNYGDTYYVMDYFTIAKFITLFLIVFGILLLRYKKLIAKKN